MSQRRGSPISFAAAVVLYASSLSGAASGAIFTVTNTNDSGPGSLRQAILDANALSGSDTIQFQIPGPGPYTISPTSALPVISGVVLLDGASQPGFGAGSRVEISGASAGPGVDGLVLNGSLSTVRGLAINRFQAAFLGGGGNGIVLQGTGGNILVDNRIGTNVAGTAVLGNGAAGVLVSDSDNNRIGAAQPGEAPNLISGNGTGIRLVGGLSYNNTLAGNLIGTDVSGTLDRGNLGDGVAVLGGTNNRLESGTAPLVISGNDGNGVTIAGSASSTTVRATRIGLDAAGMFNLPNGSDGIEISGSTQNFIGGAAPADRNVISGNLANGVLLISGASNNVIQGNFIGTDLAGFTARGNGANGVIASAASGNTIGGLLPGAGNRIAGNGTNGVRLRSGASGNVVLGNFIGNVGGVQALPNARHGVEILDSGSNDNVIGGPNEGHGNVIARNSLSGVVVQSPASRTQIVRNSIFENGAIGIDLGEDGVSANDLQDADSGANLLQNFPVISQVAATGGSTNVQGTLHSTPQTLYILHFYASPRCDPSGHGEGQDFLGSDYVTTDGNGDAPFSVNVSRTLGNRSITATATDPAGNTSEFSNCVPMASSFFTLAPCRVADTRTTDGPALTAGSLRTIVFAGRCGIPPSALAVAINATVSAPTVPGHLTFFPPGDPLPFTSTLNFRAGQTRPNNAIVTLGVSGDASVFAGLSSGTVHLIIDVVGYFE